MVTRDHLIKKTKRDLILRSLSTLLPIALLIWLSLVPEFDGIVVYKSIVTLRFAIFVALEGYLGFKIYRYIKILTDVDYCDLVLTQKNDERVSYIRLRTNAFVVKALIYVIGIALIVTGFINAFMFCTLLGVMAAIIVIYVTAYIYFNKKY